MRCPQRLNNPLSSNRSPLLHLKFYILHFTFLAFFISCNLPPQTTDTSNYLDTTPVTIAPKIPLNAPVCENGGGGDWTALGPFTRPDPLVGPNGYTATGLGRIISTAYDPYDPTGRTVYAGGASAGLWRTTNVDAAEPIWTCITDSSRRPIYGITGIVITKIDGVKTIFISTGYTGPGRGFSYGIGVLRSDDEGRSWQPTALQMTAYESKGRTNIYQLRQHPTDPRKMYALAKRTLFATDDAWQTMYKIPLRTAEGRPLGPQQDITWLRYRDLRFHPTRPNTLYLSHQDAGAKHGGGGLVISRDGGKTWTESTPPQLLGTDEPVVGGIDIGVTAQRPDWIYLACQVGTRSRLRMLKSEDAGRTWTEIAQQRGGPNDFSKNFLAVSPADPNTLYIGEVYTYKSSDGGATWKKISKHQNNEEYTHVDSRSVAPVPGAGDVMIHASDGGVSLSYDGGARWRDISGKGLNAAQFYGISSAADYSAITGGLHDSGFKTYYPATDQWIKPYPDEDAAATQYSLTDPAVLTGLTFFSNVRTSTDRGRNWKKAARGLSKQFTQKLRPIATDAAGRVYVGHERVYRRDTGAVSWEPLGEAATRKGKKMTALALAESDPQRMYIAYGHTSSEPKEKFYRSDDGGTTWTDLTDNLSEALTFSGGGITSIIVDPWNADRLWTATDRHHRDYKVLYSEDAGRTWTNQSAGLPDFPVNVLLYESGTTDRVYAGTDVGVFVLDNAAAPGGQWQCFSGGMPVAIVQDLEINYCANQLIAGTFGRGLYVTPLDGSGRRAATIADAQRWTEPRVLHNDLVIGRKGKLRLEAPLYFTDGAGLRVERGGELILTENVRFRALCPGEQVRVEARGVMRWE